MLHVMLGWEALLFSTATLSYVIDSALPPLHLPFGEGIGIFASLLFLETFLFLLWLAKVLLARPNPKLQSESFLCGILVFAAGYLALRVFVHDTIMGNVLFLVLSALTAVFLFWISTAFVIDLLFYWEGPFPVPFFGMTLGMIKNYDRLFDYEASFSKNHSYYGKIFTQRILFVMEPQDVEHMLKTNQPNYEQGYLRKRAFEDLLGDGIFNVDGHDWVMQRKSASREFSVSRFRDYMVEVFAEGAGELMGKLENVVGKKDVQVDIQDLYFRLTLKSFAKIAFGLEVNTFDGEKQPPFAISFDVCTRIVNDRFFDMFWELKRFFQIGSERTFTQQLKVLDDYVYSVVRDRRESSNSGVSGRCDMLSQFLTIRDEKGHPPSDKYLRDLIINFLLAGRDTTASALAWTTFLLAHHPGQVHKLRDEMDRIMGKDRDTNRIPTFEELRDMQYLHAIVTESLRLYPPVADELKVAAKADVMPSGAYVQEGMWVSYMPFGMGRNERFYDEPMKFSPERWMDADGKCVRFSPYRFPVFQAGPRQCLGIDFAYLETKLMIASLFQRFDVQLAVSPEDVTYEVNLTMPIKNGLPVHVSLL